MGFYLTQSRTPRRLPIRAILSRFNADYLAQAIASELGIAPEDVVRAIRSVKIPPDVRLRVIDLHKRGYDCGEIVRKTGQPRNRVNWIVRQWRENIKSKAG